MKNNFILYTLFLATVFFSCKPEDVTLDIPAAPAVTKAKLTFKFNSLFNNAPISWPTFYKTAAGDTIRFTAIKYIFSNFILEKTNSELVKIDDAYGYINPAGGISEFSIKVPFGDYKSLTLEIGLDSVINHGDPVQWGKKYPEHPLNPSVNNMYWSWNGGYIFNVVEGYYKNNGLDNAFSFHVALDKNVRNYLFSYNYSVSKNSTFSMDIHTDKIFSNIVNFSLKTDGSFSHSANPDVVMDKFLNNANGVIEIKDFK